MDFDFQQMAHRYQEDGFFVVHGFFCESSMTALSQQVDNIYQQWKMKNEEAVREKGVVNMHSLTSHSFFEHNVKGRALFFEQCLPLRLSYLLDKVFQRDLYFHNTQLFFNPFDQEQRPYWHRDLQFSSVSEGEQVQAQGEMLSLHVRIPLNTERGIVLVPGSHKRWDSPDEHDVRFSQQNYVSDAFLRGELYVDLAPGDLLIFDAQMLHRGHYAEQGERLALDLCVGAEHHLITPFLDSRVLPTHSELKVLSSRLWFERAIEIARKQGQTLPQ